MYFKYYIIHLDFINTNSLYCHNGDIVSTIKKYWFIINKL
uniref:Uncharacterized protein n=1 Tax=viral metagenome TaxID=1070528 RepID=A0A6C0HZT1_9ZZZZ